MMRFELGLEAAEPARARQSTALSIFGYIKDYFTGLNPWRSRIQTILIEGLAVAVAFAFAVARLIG